MKHPSGPPDIIAVVRPHESAKRPAPERFTPALLFIALVVMAPAALAQPVVVTLEQPGVQQSSLFTNPAGFGATNVSVERFNELSPGFRSTAFPFAANASLGSYDHGQIQLADAFGGADGTGTYLTVKQGINKASNLTTLTFSAPQRYFGMWWSAGDPNNVLQFFSGTTLLETFKTADVVNFINAQPNKTAFSGNPNQGQKGQNKGKPYAFINFYADLSNPGLTFNRIVLSNLGAGFESDNHTIATSYVDISGKDIDPNTPIDLGGNKGSTDTIGVKGPQSTLTDSGTAVIGGGGSGGLAVIDGGKVNDGGTIIGENPGSSGTVLVDGAGSQLNDSGTLSVGPAGSGILDVADGGAITANGGATVGPHGTIDGNGTITTPTLINDGVVMPTGQNGSPGTLTETGNYQQGPSGALDIGIGGATPSQADELKINGNAHLDGTLIIAPSNNFHPSPGNTYEILSTTGTLSGDFTHIVDRANTTGLSEAVIVTPNGVVVTYLPPGLGVFETAVSTPLPATLTGNLNSVLLPLLDPNVGQLAAPFDIWFSLANTQCFNLEARFDDIIAGSTGFVSNIAPAPPPPSGKELVEGKGVVAGTGKEVAPSPLVPAPGLRWGVWATGYGDFVDISDQNQKRGYNYTTGGLTVGIDYRLTDHFVVGIMGGYAHTWTNLKPSGSVDVDSGWGGLYVGYFDHGFYLIGAAFGGANSFDTNRASLGGFARGSSDSQEWSAFFSGGYDFHFGHLTVGPTWAVQYSYENTNGFTENGSIVPVKVNSDSEESWRTDVGFRVWYNFQCKQIAVRPFVRATWEHEYKESALPITASLADFSGLPTTVFGPSLGHDSAVVNAGVSVQWTPRFSTYVSYDGQLGRDRYDSNGVSGGFTILF
jgi:outer membrane autotransporter protein